MEHHHHHQKTSSRDTFSFPSTPSQDQDSEFEFGCFTPDFPSTVDSYKTSPADHLFYNGRLLPHSFPVVLQQQQQTPTTPMVLIESISRASSRTSSVSSKDSLMSSRSNSVNSSRSSVSCSSSRPSWSSDNSERKLLYHSTKLASRTPMASKLVMAQLYGSSQRWQHVTPIPALKPEDSKRKKGSEVAAKQGLMRNKKEGNHQQGKKDKSSGICQRFFRSFLVACRECHAMEPSTEDDIFQGSVKL
ncbi:hypothetical protein P3X46_006853 [Hevea brasiliensis]|uniref:DUF4005 domain-containing protein n=1 Tax=Hevea brasiliensis TaxID=3981 RepID=A0ABQ9MVG1_HEVBR|nr:probable membrane-associated kinase regulator 3 [Hevea brasiliensis]KAJ9182920.1 hypothetical protein P3X46_006853 [Hevea brasiliensis]